MKADRAEAIIGGGGVISVQVLNELANVARRKMRMSWPDTHAFLSLLRGLLTVQPITIETHETGLALAERYNLSIYDAMIAASALHADCDTLWSEDMQHGMVLDEAAAHRQSVSRGALSDQPQPRRRMERAHQQVHRDHSGQRRRIVRGRAQHPRHADILDRRQERHDCEDRRGGEGQPTVRACLRPLSTPPDIWVD